MNFNFGYTQKRFGSQPNMRQYSTIGILPNKVDIISKNIDKLTVFNTPILSSKSFSNPNFVNKHHPNILAPSLVGFVKFDNDSQNPSTKYNESFTETSRENYKSQDETSTGENINNQVDISEYELLKSQSGDCQHKESSQNHKKNCALDKSNETPNITEQSAETPKQGTTNLIKLSENTTKTNTLKTSPRMRKKNNSNKRRRRSLKRKQSLEKQSKYASKHKRNPRNKMKPWHKSIEVDLSESTLDSDSSNMTEEMEKPYCIMITKSTPIDIKPGLNVVDSSSMSISPCHHELLKSLSLSSLSKSPCSPALRRCKMPSECDSEDSFIVFEERESETDDDSDFDEETDTSEDESDCDVIFNNCDISNNQKKVRTVKSPRLLFVLIFLLHN